MEAKPYAAGQAGAAAASNSNDEVDTACSYFYFLWARNAELNGRYDEAQEAYEKATVCDGRSDYIVRRLAALLLKIGKKKQAIHWMEKLIAEKPHEIELKVFLADLYASVDELSKAAAIYEQVLANDPKNDTVMLKLGKLYLKNLEYTKARNIFERLVKNTPDSFAGYYYLARLYRELGYADKASAAYQRTMDIDWSVPLALEAAGFYEQQGDDKEAIIIYKKILAGDEEDEFAVGRLVRIYMKHNESDKALNLLRSLRNGTLDSQKIDFTIGRIYMEQKDYAKAIALFKQMLERNPELDVAKSLLGLAYYESGDVQRAKDLLLKIGPDDEGYTEVTSLLVKIYEKEGKIKEAAHLLRKAISKTSEDEQLNFYFALAGLYEANKQPGETEKVFEEVISHFPDSVEAYLQYGMFMERTGRPNGAMSQMQKVLSIDPDNILALNYVGYTWADQGIKLEEALKYIKKAVAAKPEDGFIRDSLGWVYFKLGDLKRAVAELERALAYEPEDPTIREHLGDVYRAKHELPKALRNYQKSLQFFENKADKDRLQGKIDTLKN